MIPMCASSHWKFWSKKFPYLKNPSMLRFMQTIATSQPRLLCRSLALPIFQPIQNSMPLVAHKWAAARDFHTPQKRVLVWMAGGGEQSTGGGRQRLKQRLTQIGDVETFDYDYMREGRKRPDRLPQLIAAQRQALAVARGKTSGPIFLIGKSMGGRIGCHVALEEKASGVICLGYPLCGGGDRSKLRDQVMSA